VRRTWTWT